jgi:hypothetical protein
VPRRDLVNESRDAMRIRVLVQLTRPSQEAIRRREPLTFGVPLPRGQATDADVWCLRETAGTSFNTQTRTLDRWPDGSVRWMLVDSLADLSLVSPVALTLERRPADSSTVTATLSVVEDAEGVIVETGTARFTTFHSFPFDEVVVAGDNVIDASRSGLRVIREDGGSCKVSIQRFRVVERGPVRCCVALEGVAQTDSNAEFLRLTARIHFFAGLSTVRLQVCLTNPNRAQHPGGFWDLGDPGSVFLRDASLELALPRSTGPTTVRCSPEVGTPWDDVAIPFELYQDSSGGMNWDSPSHIDRRRRVPNSFRGYRLTSGGAIHEGFRATPIVAVTDETRQLAATLPLFWQNFPKSIEVGDRLPAPTLTVRLFPRQYAIAHEIQGGEQKTHELFLSFGPDPVTDRPLEWCRSRALASAHPDWMLSTGAVAFLAPLGPDHAALVNAAIEGPNTFELKREVVDEYGWRHFGEVYGDHEAVRHEGPKPLVSHYNNQYDAVAGFAYQYLRTSDPRWWALMTDLAAHVVDIDVYHTVRDKWAYNHGLFWHTYHYGDADTATHRTYPRSALGRTHGGGPSADHNYTTGLMLHHFLTGEEPSRETAIALAEFVINLDDGSKTVLRWLNRGDTGAATMSAGPSYFGPGRGPANSLNALLDGYRLTGDVRFIRKAEQLIRRVVHPADDIAARELDDPERRWFYTMFFQSLGKYLNDKLERGQLDVMYGYAHASLLHYARWMAEHEYPYLERPEKLEFPTETWGAHEIRKSDVFDLAAMCADTSDRPRLIERGRFFYRTALETLERMPTRALARPVVVLLSSGLVASWFERHSDARMPAPRAGGDFGRPGRFVSQRERAKRRLKLIAASGAVVSALAALYELLR